jgi:hypothetical protein
MSLEKLFQTFKYDEEARLSIQRQGDKYWFTVGAECYSVSFEHESSEIGMQIATEIAAQARTAHDLIENRAEIVRRYAISHDQPITCLVQETVPRDKTRNRLICKVKISLGTLLEKEFEPVCGWSNDDVTLHATALLFPYYVAMLNASDELVRSQLARSQTGL